MSFLILNALFQLLKLIMCNVCSLYTWFEIWLYCFQWMNSMHHPLLQIHLFLFFFTRYSLWPVNNMNLMVSKMIVLLHQGNTHIIHFNSFFNLSEKYYQILEEQLIYPVVPLTNSSQHMFTVNSWWFIISLVTFGILTALICDIICS